MFKINHYNKIAIVGGPGTGKTTLSNVLGKLYDLPVHHMDHIKFDNNWVQKPKKEIYKQINLILETDKWIIEGNSLKSISNILDKATIVIFLDFSLFLQLKGIFERFHNTCIYNNKIIKNCSEKITFKFFIKTILYNIVKKQKLLKVFKNFSSSKILVFKNRDDISSFFKYKKSI